MATYHLSVKAGKNANSSGSRGASHYAYINRDGKSKRADIEKIESGTPTKQQISSFERIMKNEFKKYKARLELEKIKEDEKKLLAGLKKEAQVAQAKDRKKREHKLITIGALFEMVDFPSEDKGIITGMLLSAIENAKNNSSYFDSLKASGDKFINDREQAKKSKSTLVDNSGSVTAE